MGGTVRWLVAAGLVASLFAVPVTSALGEARATYEIHEEEGTVTYSETGGAMPVIECDGGWSVGLTTVSSAADDSHRLTIEVDSDENEVSLAHRHDGSWTWQTFHCDEGTPAPTVPATGWREEQAAADGGDEAPLLPSPLAPRACEDPPVATVEGLAPFEDEMSTETQASADASPVCVQARAAAEVPDADRVPFTGTVTATLADENGQELWTRTCLVVFGTCWDEGEADAEMATPRPDGTSQWTLTCETSPIFTEHYHAVGSFSCRAWLG